MKSPNFVVTLIALLGLAAALALPASAEVQFESSLALSEEYNDNIYLSPDKPMTDYVTRVLPSIRMVYEAPFWEWDLAYTFDYRAYLYKSKTHDSTHALILRNRTNLVPDRLFFELQDTYNRVSLDTVRDYTQQSLFVNQSDRNELSLSPYLVFDLTSQTSGTAGYQYRNLWYREEEGINKSGHSVFVDLADELGPRTKITGGIRYLHEDADERLSTSPTQTFVIATYDKIDIYAGPRYEYAEGSFVWLILGNSWISPEKEIRQTQGFWDVGIAHRFLTYTLTLNAALTYIDDPQLIVRRQDRYTATFQKNTERWTLAATVGRWEYRNFLTKRLQSTRNGLGGTLGYALTRALRGSYSFNIDRYEDNTLSTYSMLYLNSLRLEYQFPANTTLALDWRSEHGYSPDKANFYLNYDNNRVALEIRRIF